MALGRKPIEIVNEGKHQLLTKADHWDRVFLGKVARVQNGFAFSSKHFAKNEGMPLIRIRDINRSRTVDRYNGNYSEEYLVRKGDFLVGMDGDFKAAIWRGEDALLNQRVCRIVPTSKDFDANFLFLCLQPYLNAINEETSSVTVKHLSSKTIEEIPLPYPKIEEQQAIVSKIEELFSELDKGIEQLKVAQQQLKTYRQSVLKWAFEGRLTNENVKDGELPEGWELTKLESVGRLYCGQSSTVTEVNNVGKGTLYVTGPEQWDGRQIEQTKWTINPKRIVPEGTIFITVKGAGVGKMFPGISCAIGRDVYAYLPSEFLCFKFAFYALKHSIDLVVLKAQGDIPGLAKHHILDHEIGICKMEEQIVVVKEIESRLSVADKMEESITQSLQQAEVLRQSVLKKAFEGNLI